MTDGVSDRIAEVEAKSAGFRKELGLRDLVFTQIVYVVGSGWVGTAAKLGTDHVAFWLLAIALYYLPQAVVVIALARLMPVEGGPYQWAREALGPALGFLTAWTLWAYTITVMATFAIVIATNIAYFVASIVGPDGESVTKAGWYTPLTSIVAITGVTLVSILGLRVGKWLQNIGAAAHLLTFSALIIVPFVAVERGVLVDYHPLAATLPAVSLLSLNIFAKQALGALSGFEYVAILAGETRSPARTIGRSVGIAVPIIAMMFILGTSSTLALVPAKDLDLVSPIPQTLTIGFAGLGFASAIVPVLIGMLLLRQIGAVTLIFAGNTRLPMVAGWDGLLPAWFTRIHPRFGTPVNSILVVGAITLAFCLAGQAGVGLQEAFQLIENVAGILYGFVYLALFAIPLVGTRRLAWRPPLWLRVASASGFAVTLLYCVLSIFPIIEVESWQVFALKIVAVLVAVELLGVALYVRAARMLPARKSSK
jgi:glutamate:GABA antiporter